MRFKTVVQNVVMTLTGVLIAWLLAEYVLFKPMMRLLPVHMYNHMVREFRVLGQSSKDGVMPQPGYVALMGDSFAQGKGDWFIETGYNRYAGFHSAHLLQKDLGRDVLTFGRSGSGSVEGLIVEPLQTERFLAREGVQLPEPSLILYYFYEGNDMEDNVMVLHSHLYPDRPEGFVPTRADLEQFVRRVERVHASGQPREPQDGFLFGSFILRLLRDKVWNPVTHLFVEHEPVWPTGSVNRFLVDGEAVTVPDHLQGAALQMPRERLERSLMLFDVSLEYARELYRDVPMMVVYVPAPLTCYEVVSAKVSTEYGSDRLFDASTVTERSDEIYAHVRAEAKKLGLPFIDTREALRRGARKELLHGPRDWRHLNRKGYEIFSRVVVDGIRQNGGLPPAQ